MCNDIIMLIIIFTCHTTPCVNLPIVTYGLKMKVIITQSIYNLNDFNTINVT